MKAQITELDASMLKVPFYDQEETILSETGGSVSRTALLGVSPFLNRLDTFARQLQIVSRSQSASAFCPAAVPCSNERETVLAVSDVTPMPDHRTCVLVTERHRA